MKRDIFYRNTQMKHHHGPHTETDSYEYFDADLPKGVQLNSKPFTAAEHGHESWHTCPDAIRKPNGELAQRDQPIPEQHKMFTGLMFRRKR